MKRDRETRRRTRGRLEDWPKRKCDEREREKEREREGGNTFSEKETRLSDDD